MNISPPSALCSLCLLLVACSSGPPRITTAKEIKSMEDAQHAFFPNNGEYTIGDFVLSLPVGYYEGTSRRLAFASGILRDATPKPVLEQIDYLELPAGALDPKRQFLLLDQHHILIHGEPFDLVTRSPAELTVLERKDASWTDVTSRCLPDWAKHPDTFAIEPDTKRIHLTFKEPARRVTCVWGKGKFSVIPQ